MAKAKKKSKAKEIDVNVPKKKNELSLEFMKAYIEAKVDSEELDKAKEEFKAAALVEGKYDAKSAKDYFVANYPDAIKVSEKKKNDATTTLNEW